MQAVEGGPRFSYIECMHFRILMKRSLGFIGALLVVSAAPCDVAPAQSAGSPLARAGNVYVTEDEFVRRFELLPAFGRQRRSQLEEAKAELLYSMIAEKLLAQEAEAQGMDREPQIMSALDDVRKMLARDELYRIEVINAVRVDERELLQGVMRARRQLSVGYIYVPEEADARFVRGRLTTRNDLWAAALDSNLDAERDTVTVVWGEANSAIEDAAFRLTPGEVSPVVRAENGFYLLTLEGEQSDGTVAGMPTDALMARVRKTLRLRKEHVRLDAYMAQALKDKTGYAVTRSLRALADACARVTETSAADSMVVLTPAHFDLLRTACAPQVRDSLAVADSAVWTLGAVLDRLSLRNLTIPARNPRGIMQVLDGHIRALVQQELLAHEALRRGLDSIPSVRDRLVLWKQYFLAERLKDRLKSSVQVTDAEAWSYLRGMDTSLTVPRVQVRELQTRSLDSFAEALADLERGVPLEEVVVARSIDSAARPRGGVSEWFSITDRYPVGEIAWAMQPGQRFGPVNVRGGYLYFELLGKQAEPEKGDSAVSARLAGAHRALVRLKQNRRITLFLSQSADERGFAVYEDRLKALPVTPVPMMTFRILGFGGRMFEVPFVDKQIEWLGVEPPSSKILP